MKGWTTSKRSTRSGSRAASSSRATWSAWWSARRRSWTASEAEALQKKVFGKQRFTLEDFLVAMRQVQKMGPIDQLMKMVPGMARGHFPAGAVDPKKMKHIEAIILSMTPAERRRPPKS